MSGFLFFDSRDGIFTLPKFLRRHKGRIIKTVTPTTRIRPSTYHSLYKTLETHHEHNLKTFSGFLHSVILFDCYTYRTIFGLCTLKAPTKGEKGPHLGFADSLSIHGSALTQVGQISIVTRQSITLPWRSVRESERQNNHLSNLI